MLFFDLEFCLYPFSPDPTRKVSEFFNKNADARFFRGGLQKNSKKTPTPPSVAAATEGAADSEAATAD